MIKDYKVITLCGSTKFKDEFIKVQKELTLKGSIVISVGLFGHSGDIEVWTDNTKQMLDDMHKAKIDLADEIFVINKNGYIGESTKSEIEYALKQGKSVKYLEDTQTIKEFLRLGYSQSEAEELANASFIGDGVTLTTLEESTAGLQEIMKNYNNR